jgi:hypothetical protein
MSIRSTIAGSALVLALLGAASAGAHGAATGTIVVRLVTDPSPAGVAWTYAGAGAPFQLGAGSTEHSVTGLADGTYRLTEKPTAAGPGTLTALGCADPSGGSRTALASATADVALSSGETVTCTFTHRALGPRPAASAVALAEQFAPTLRLSAAEHYKPVAMQDYLSRAVLRTGAPPRGRAVQLRPTLFSLPVAASPSYLDIRGAEPYSQASQYRSIEQQLERARPRPTVYWQIARQPSTGRIAIEYWLLYLYNDFADRHEADWEGVTVVVDGGTPLGVAYSQHQGRSWVAWPAAATDDHPLVYVAAGSHANYPLPGAYRVKVCWTLSVRRCTTSTRRDEARGDGATLASSGYDLQALGGTGYTGSWGSGSYLLGVGLTRDRIVDPRRRSDYSNPFAAIRPRA